MNGVRDPEHPTNTHINDANVGRIKDGLKQLLISEEVEEGHGLRSLLQLMASECLFMRLKEHR